MEMDFAPGLFANGDLTVEIHRFEVAPVKPTKSELLSEAKSSNLTFSSDL